MANVHIDNKLLDVNCMYDDIEYEISELTKKITAHHITITRVIEDLEFLLTSKEIRHREHGTNLLSEILIQLPSDFLNETELKYITDFYNSRLKDHYQILPPTFKGIVGLADMKNLPDEVAQMLVSTLLEYVAIPNCSGPDRGNVYLFLSKFFNTKIDEMQKVDALVYHILSAIDGEKDLFILRFLFRWLPTFFQKVTLGHLAEEAFDIVSCYFPIDLRISHYVPSSGQDEIRTEMATDLQECLCAVPEFSEFCIPLALQKLKSDLRTAKLDSFKLLTRSCNTFPVKVYEKHRTAIVACIHRGIIGNSDAEIISTALCSLDAILKIFFRDSNPAIFTEISRTIVLTSRDSLIIDSKTFNTANMILTCVSNASETGCQFIVESCIPILIEQYITLSDDLDKISSILSGLAAHVAIYKKHFNTLGNNEQFVQIIEYCIKAIDDDRQNIKIAGLNGLVLLADCIDDRDIVYKRLLKIIIEEKNSDIRDSVISLLKTFASLYSDEVISCFLHNSYFSTCEYDNYLDLMCAVASIDNFGNEILTLCSERCFDDDLQIRQAMMRCYRNVVTKNSNQIQKWSASQRFLNRIIDDFISFANKRKYNDTEDVFFEHVLEVMCNLIEIDNEQTLTVNTYVPKLLSLCNENCSITVILFEGLLTRLKRDINIPFEEKIIDYILDIIFDKTQMSSVQKSAERLLSNLLNKANDPKMILYKIESILLKIESSINDPDIENTVVHITASTTKALILRNHTLMKKWIDKMIEHLSLCKSAAVGFQLVMTDDPLSLNAKSNCQMSVLYKQKFFTMCCTKLEKLSKDNEDMKEACDSARAIAYLIENTSSTLIIMHFSKIISSIIHCLLMDDTDILCIVLSKLNSLLENREQILIKHVQDLIPALITLSSYKNSMTVRTTALSCLNKFACYPDIKILLLYKQNVISGILTCLDDKKRLVRRTAAEARSRWCAVNDSS